VITRELTAGYLADELQRPFRSKEFVVLEIAVCCPDVGRKHIDGFTKSIAQSTIAMADDRRPRSLRRHAGLRRPTT
jgi:hypothetical protein